jgi:hypothetical protein
MTMTKCLGCAVAQSSDEEEQAHCDQCDDEGLAGEFTECDGCGQIVCDDCRECGEDCFVCRDAESGAAAQSSDEEDSDEMDAAAAEIAVTRHHIELARGQFPAPAARPNDVTNEITAAENTAPAAVTAENAALATAVTAAPAVAEIRFPVPRHPIYHVGSCSGCGTTDVSLQCPTCPTAACAYCQSGDVEFVCVDEVDYCLPCSGDPAAAEQARPHAYEVAENALAENAAAVAPAALAESTAVAVAPVAPARRETTTGQHDFMLCDFKNNEVRKKFDGILSLPMTNGQDQD